MTGIKGLYSIDLRSPRNEPDLIGLIERQLGLKLEKRRIPLDVLVVDHAEQVPTEN